MTYLAGSLISNTPQESEIIDSVSAHGLMTLSDQPWEIRTDLDGNGERDLMARETTGDREADAVQLLHEAYTRWADMPPVRLTVPRRDAWIVMMALQQVVSHPAIADSPMHEVLENVGRHIQEGVSDDPRLYAVAEAGWNRAFDVEPGAGEG